MHSVLLRDGFSVSKANARLRIESTLDLQKLFRVIDADPLIVGAGVVYIDSDLNVVTLRDFQPICSVAVKHLVLREAPRYMAAQSFAQRLENDARESRVVFETIGMALSCVGALISWSVVCSSSALIPFSAGASAAVTFFSYAAATATSAQCLNAAARTANELIRPEWNDWLDSQVWYGDISLVLDAISLLGVSVTLLTTVRSVQIIKATTGKSVRDVLRGLSRQEREKLTKELLSIQNPTLTPALINIRIKAGEWPRRYTQARIRQGTLIQIRDCLGAGLAVAGSALSGTMRSVAIGIFSEWADE
ncbi:NAD synthetase [uncultured Pseudomonas sp.]|uniref:NAD synthetase n=1 Tax=uncultured Pseudomonas sp. TaxID=114707 RepID=UPI0025D2AA5E|nr:NAD synthetase [uncultured Pseudomonas sp.]